MGVGAIFIGTLARTNLPEGLADHDTEQVDRLRNVLLPIISFLVLSSVITRDFDLLNLSRANSQQMACPSRSSPSAAAFTASRTPGLAIRRETRDLTTNRRGPLMLDVYSLVKRSS